MDGQGHLLSLKVMRVSRPSIASAWEPFYSSSPSFSAHSTASILSLQGKSPLPGHPKTLRDLYNDTELLTLPSSFGAIQLGETFSGVLAINNETVVAVDGVNLKIEMQTATNKVLLAELGGPTQSLVAGDTLETIVNHEIKELGQHVLACTVTYQLPPGARPPQPPSDGQNGDSNIQTFRKFYKFAVTNPLSVKTKVHTPRSPSALLSRSEREKVFLEVHIQNLTQEPMWFERMLFEPAQGWQVEEGNVFPPSDPDATESESLFTGSQALMQPQDIRQYMYILAAVKLPTFAVQHTPGSIIPLGRLDISWRSSFGEPGRLLTSMLSRRIPVPTVQSPPRQPASALPPYLQRGTPTTTANSPTPSHSRPGSRSSTPPIGPSGTPAPYRPTSPFKNRPMSVPPRSQSPVTTFGAAGNALALRGMSPGAGDAAQAASMSGSDAVDVDLIVREIPRDDVFVEKPFKVAFTLAAAAPVPTGKERVLTVVVQHVQLPMLTTTSSTSSSTGTQPTATETAHTPRVQALTITSPSTTSTPLSRQTSISMLSSNERTLVGSPIEQPSPLPERPGSTTLPQPVPAPQDEEKYVKSAYVRYLGPSAIFLPPLRLSAPVVVREPGVGVEGGGEAEGEVTKDILGVGKRVEGSWDFELEYLPRKTGFWNVGGLRVVLVGDRYEDSENVGNGEERKIETVRVLKEWDVVGEVWVKSVQE